MSDLKKFSLYDEEKSTTTDVSTTGYSDFDTEQSFLIEIDLSQNLYNLCKPIREYLKDKPETLNLSVYLVSGTTSSPDIHLFLDYLKTLPNPISVYFRGIIHVNLLPLFFKFENILVDRDCRLKYDPKELDILMFNLLVNPMIFNKFIQRFSTDYHRIKNETYFDLTELNILGFNLQTF